MVLYIITYQEKLERFISSLTEEEKAYHLNMMSEIAQEAIKNYKKNIKKLEHQLNYYKITD